MRIATEDDFDRIFALTAQAFNAGSMRERMREEFDPGEYRVVDRNGSVAACLRVHRFAHFWGGREVPAAGIGGVAVAPEARGKGLGSGLMAETLRDLRAGGIVLSSLYPATSPIYRAAGYGFGGVRTTWKVPLAHLRPASALEVEPFDASAFAAIDACYRAVGANENGLVVRPEKWWHERVWKTSGDRPAYRYLVREDGEVTGWIDYVPEYVSGGGFRFRVTCRDLHWRTVEAGKALLSVAALHRSTAETMTWVGPAIEPLADLMPEDQIEHERRFRFMVRLADVPGAIEARGYHSLVDASVTIRVHDATVPDNAGTWQIAVGGGAAKVTPGGEAEIEGDASAWATVWSGFHRARDVARTGGIRGSGAAIEALEAMFSGGAPWLSDFY